MPACITHRIVHLLLVARILAIGAMAKRTIRRWPIEKLFVMTEGGWIHRRAPQHMLPVRTLFSSRYLLHFAKQYQIFVLDRALTFKLIEIASSIFVLFQLLFHLYVVTLNDAFFLFHLILPIDFLEAYLVLFVGVDLFNPSENMLLIFLQGCVHICV